MSNDADYKLICKSTVCREITEDEAKTLAAIMGVRQLQDGELLVSEGDADQSLYILASGKLGVISAGPDGKEHLVHTMIEGECAGTRAFVDRTPRKATLRAIGNATVYSITPDAFQTVVDAHPRLAYKVMRALFRVTHANLMRMNQESQQLSNYIRKSGGGIDHKGRNPIVDSMALYSGHVHFSWIAWRGVMAQCSAWQIFGRTAIS